MPSEAEAGRAQDQGRRHRRKGAPSPETALLLTDYQEAMRDELRTLLGDIRGHPPADGLGLIDAQPVRPSLKDRAPMWDLAIKIGRELGTAIDPGADKDQPTETPRRRTRKVDFG